MNLHPTMGSHTRPPHLPFATVAATALQQLDAVLLHYLPHGKRQGHEYVALNPVRNDAQPGSFKVNLNSGAWSDFATGDKGGDAVSLVAYLTGSNQGQAADALADWLVMARVSGNANNRATRTGAASLCADAIQLCPVPDDAPALPSQHPQHGKPSAQWTYLDAQGRTLFHVCRFDAAGGGKQVLPLTLWRMANHALQWQWKGLPTPRPLYGVHKLAACPHAPVLVCEGEKATDAAQRLLPDWVCITSPNGAAAAHKTDWQPIADRVLTVWPDADTQGMGYAVAVEQLALQARACAVRLFDTTLLLADGEATLPQGFDAADYEAQGRDAATLANAIAQALPFGEPATATTATVATPKATDAADTGWPELLPLIAKVEPQPYPLDALPPTLRAAVEEVQGFVQAPVAMVASCALSALSLALQHQADVKRAEMLTGPVALFLLTIGDSGERKSSCDGYFTKPLRDYEQQQAEAAKPDLKQYACAISAWEAKRSGVIAALQGCAKKGEDSSGHEAFLLKLEDEKPSPPRVPRLIYGDATPEALAWSLAKGWPSGGVVSSEAGVVFGAHGMGKDSITRNLAFLNVLWDGGSQTIDRRTSESFTVQGARLTVALQVQEPTLRAFFERSGALARGTGFLARFLLAWPPSTQGYRPFDEPPANWPALAVFSQRITALLSKPVPIDDDGVLHPPLLGLDAAAKAAWVLFHDSIESELRTGGELYDVRDVASKSADNAARLAALFQLFEDGGTTIGLPAFEGASRIAAWHLHESRRFFGELALPLSLANAVRLDTWLLAWCQREGTRTVSRRDLQRCGPNGLRDKDVLDETLRELDEAGRVRLHSNGHKKTVEVRPSLLAGAQP